jgi:hypothetical protein
MPQDQRILDIIAASTEQRPADATAIVNELIGERIHALVDQRREDTRMGFFPETD